MHSPRRHVSVENLLAAVLAVDGVRDARVNTGTDGDQTLQLALHDGADELAVARQVAQILDNNQGFTVDTARLGGEQNGRVAHRNHTSAPVADHVDVGAGAGRVEASQYSVGVKGPDTDSDRAIPRELARALAAGPPRRIQLDRVQMSTSGLECEIEVTLLIDDDRVAGVETGPAAGRSGVRIAAAAAANALGAVLNGRARVAVEYAGICDVGPDQVVLVLAAIAMPGRSEQLPGVALVRGDPRQAAAKALIAAVDRRLVPLLSSKSTGVDEAVASKTALVPILADSSLSAASAETTGGRHSVERAQGSGDSTPWYQRQLPAPRSESDVESIQTQWA